ncbi:MAG: flagellar protein FlgN [Clostridia bacterium]|nr:flagellar protein FlgN [Clostridia bacterium]MDR3645350.1 flagellar protein FlgN [Clostridia bacterium]
MNSWAQELEDALQKERGVLNELSDLAERERDVIVSGDVARMDLCLNDEMPLLMQLDYLEERRRAILSKAGMTGNTLSEAADMAGEGEREVFLELLCSMRGITARLKRVNDLNGRLVRSRLELYDMMRGGHDRGVYYGAYGMTEEKSPIRSLIDQKI